MNERRRRSPVPVQSPMEIDENLPRNGICENGDITPQILNPKAMNPLQDCSNRTNRQHQGNRKRKSNEMEDGQSEDPNISGPNHVSDEEEGGITIGDIHIPPPMQTAVVRDEKGPRLIITHIVNVNFKSYAGRVVLGPFHQSFTAIVGPNGSGKSNVIDSMLFVFGYRASKIRSKKISVLLHSSSRFPNITSCCVEVHFAKIQNKEDGSGYDIVPRSEIVVSRTAFKDNSSFYQLDGRRTHFKEVGALLRSQGIDLDHNRFLILQGEVEQIAMMRPKAQNEHDSGMLEYLEDIVGTSRYKVPLGQLGERVEELTDARSERLNRVRLAEADKVRLEPAMKEAVELLNVSNQAMRCRNTLLQKYIHETDKVIAEKTNTLNELKSRLSELEEELKKTKLEIREKNNTLKESSKGYETLKSQKEELDEKVKVLARKSQNLLNEITQAKKKLKNLTTNSDKENTHIAVLKQIPEKNASEIEECEKLKETLTKKKAEKQKEYEEVLANIRTQTQGLQETKDGLQARLIDLQRTQNQASQKHKLAESELKMYVSTEVSEREKAERMTNALTAANQALKDGQKSLNELSSSLPQKRKELQEAQKELEQNRQEERRLKEQIRALQQRLDESRENASASRSRGRIIDSLVQMQKQGQLRGIFGRLGDLGAIDTKYDVAISTCCPQLDNILVEEAETGQKCVEHLKKNRLGIGHFIIREKIMDKESRMYQAGAIPESVPRLFDLVQTTDGRVKVAFYHVLGDTLCTEQMDQATRIAYGRQRYRVVTIRGDVIELSGTISGGGNRKLQGKMGRTVREDTREQKQDAESLRRDEARLEEMEQRLQALIERQRVLEEIVGSLMQTLPNTEVQIQKLKMDIKNHTEQIPDLQRELKQQAQRAEQCRVDPKKKKVLEKATEAAEKLLEEAKEASAEVEKEVESVDVQISAVAGGQVKVMKKSIDDLGKKIEKIGLEVTKLKVAITSSTRDIKQSEQKLRQLAADKTDTEKRVESLQEKRSTLNTEAETARKDLLEAEQKLEEGAGDFTELRAGIEALVGRENTLKSEQLELSNSVTKEAKVVQDVKDKIPAWSGELSRMKLEDPGVTGVEGIEPVAPLAKHSADELESVDISELRAMIEGHKNRLNGLKPNLSAIQEYKKQEEVYLKRAADLDAVTAQRNEMRTVQEQLRKRRATEFLLGFNVITAKLKEMYQMITLGGDAELELVDSLDPFTEGIVFSVRPPNKSWKNISNLSGGEKTLSSLALVFALHYYKPTPLYVMDEIDAALDFKNVSIVANYITERTKNAQFIIISLRYNMFEVCNRLVGIYKTQDCTKCLAIENGERAASHEPTTDGPSRKSSDTFFPAVGQVAT